MIDQLISSDFTALAVENRQRVPALDAVLPRPGERMPIHIKRWLKHELPIAAALATASAGAGVLLELDTDTFQQSPQLAIVIVIAIAVMFNALVGGTKRKTSKPATDVIAAVMIGALAIGCFLIVWQRHYETSAFITQDGAYFHPCIDRDVYLTPGFVAIVATIVMIVARALGSRSRWNLAQWRLPAKLFTATVLVTWVSVTSFDDWGRGFAGFHVYVKPVGLGAAMAHLHSVVSMIVDPPHWVVELSPRQCDALLAALVMIGFIASITVSCLRERGRRSRWLTVLEHPAVTLLAVAFAMAALVHATVTCEPDVAAHRAVFATVGVIIAYSGMLLRRRRREALS